MIRAPRADELPLLQEIERRAGRAFATVGLPEVADDEPATVAELAEYLRDGRAWVAVDGDDRPIAYLLTEVLDGTTHIEQVSVDPAHARHGVGRALIDHASGATVTLTTFRDVPWNAPYYARLGFTVIEDLGPELAARVRVEAVAIRGGAPRVTMVRTRRRRRTSSA